MYDDQNNMHDMMHHCCEGPHMMPPMDPLGRPMGLRWAMGPMVNINTTVFGQAIGPGIMMQPWNVDPRKQAEEDAKKKEERQKARDAQKQALLDEKKTIEAMLLRESVEQDSKERARKASLVWTSNVKLSDDYIISVIPPQYKIARYTHIGPDNTLYRLEGNYVIMSNPKKLNKFYSLPHFNYYMVSFDDLNTLNGFCDYVQRSGKQYNDLTIEVNFVPELVQRLDIDKLPSNIKVAYTYPEFVNWLIPQEDNYEANIANRLVYFAAYQQGKVDEAEAKKRRY